MDTETFAQFKKRILKDKEIKAAYDALEPEYAIARAIIAKRLNKGMTQTQLAQKIGTKQAAVSRLESGDSNPSVNFLKKVAKALGLRLVVKLS